MNTHIHTSRNRQYLLWGQRLPGLLRVIDCIMDDKPLHPGRDELLATFGSAQLIKTLQGTFKLRGGTEQDRHEAFEWVERFLPEATEYIFKVKTS